MKAEFFQPPIDNIELCCIWNDLTSRLKITDIEYIHFQGVFSGPFMTYDPNTLYIATELIPNGGVQVVATVYIDLYNELNAPTVALGSGFPYWDATGAYLRVYANSQTFNNVYFSRLVNSGYTKLKFTGYKLTLIP
jgi:hypothetical protein